MTDPLTGPEEYQEAQTFLQYASEGRVNGERLVWDDHPGLALQRAQIHATNALTAATVVQASIIATAMDVRDPDLDGWAEAIPATPLKECWHKETRRPQCAERHTEDCQFADPPPEPKHVLLDVGTRVLVSEREVRDGWTRYHNPVAGRISGYDMHRSKYQWQTEFEPGIYAEHSYWAGVNNSVQVHPDGPVCPPPPKPVKREPTGPRIYVQNRDGKQGHVVKFGRKGEDEVAALVQWYAPGVQPVWRSMDLITVIHPDDVERCPNGQTRDDCGSGENQCELCLADEDDEADEIEESMGLR